MLPCHEVFFIARGTHLTAMKAEGLTVTTGRAPRAAKSFPALTLDSPSGVTELSHQDVISFNPERDLLPTHADAVLSTSTAFAFATGMSKESFTVSPCNATDKPEEIGEVDVLLVCVKAWQVGHLPATHECMIPTCRSPAFPFFGKTLNAKP